MTADERRKYIKDDLDKHDEGLVAELREVASATMSDQNEDARDVAVAVAATILQPPEKFVGIPTRDHELREWLGSAGLTDEEVAAGRRLRDECVRRRGSKPVHILEVEGGRNVRVEIEPTAQGAPYSYAWWWEATYKTGREPDGVGSGFASSPLALDDALACVRRFPIDPTAR